jgi:hypothetical protein
MMSVGAWMFGRMSRMSISPIIRNNDAAAPGLAASGS